MTNSIRTNLLPKAATRTLMGSLIAIIFVFSIFFSIPSASAMGPCWGVKYTQYTILPYSVIAGEAIDYIDDYNSYIESKGEDGFLELVAIPCDDLIE